MTSDWIKES